MITGFLILIGVLVSVVGYYDLRQRECETSWIEVDHCRNDERTLEACKALYLPERCEIKGEDTE